MSKYAPIRKRRYIEMAEKSQNAGPKKNAIKKSKFDKANRTKLLKNYKKNIYKTLTKERKH